MSIYGAINARGPDLGVPNYIQRKTAEVPDDSREALRRVIAPHVPIAAGTDRDTFGHPHGTLPEELRLMV